MWHHRSQGEMYVSNATKRSGTVKSEKYSLALVIWRSPMALVRTISVEGWEGKEMDWTEEKIFEAMKIVSLGNSLKINSEEEEKYRIAVDRVGSWIRDFFLNSKVKDSIERR